MPVSAKHENISVDGSQSDTGVGEISYKVTPLMTGKATASKKRRLQIDAVYSPRDAREFCRGAVMKLPV